MKEDLVEKAVVQLSSEKKRRGRRKTYQLERLKGKTGQRCCTASDGRRRERPPHCGTCGPEAGQLCRG